MSSSATPTSSSATTTGTYNPFAYPTSTDSSTSSPGTGGASSSLYLFTFLITIVVLGLISSALLLRAYYVRRRFQRRIEEAIAAGRPLPRDAASALGLIRPVKKGKDVGPMPNLWEAEMDREKEGEVWSGDVEKGADDWEEITPLAVLHYPAKEPYTPPPMATAALMPQHRGPWFLRPFLTPRMPPLQSDLVADPQAVSPTRPGGRPSITRFLTDTSIVRREPDYQTPDDGEEVAISVLIAMPVQGQDAERWKTLEEPDEEALVPEVCLGVMSANIKGDGSSGTSTPRA